MKSIKIKVTDELKDQIKEKIKEKGESMSGYIRRLIIEDINN